MHPVSPRMRPKKLPARNRFVCGPFAGFAVCLTFAACVVSAQEVPKPAAASETARSAESEAEPSKPKQTVSKTKDAASQPAASGFGLGLGAGLLGEPRLNLGPAAGGSIAPQGRSTNSLGPLPQVAADLRSIPASGGDEPSDVEIRRRARPDLLPDGPNPTEEAAVALKNRIRYRALKARVIAEPEVMAALDAAKKASNDREMRAAFRLHYELLFARMRELDPSLESLIAEREIEANASLKVALPR